MANEIDELNSLLNQTNQQLQSFNQGLTKNASADTIFSSAVKSSTLATKESEESQRKISNSISSTMSGLTSFSKQLVDSKGSFAPLTSVVNLSTKLLGKLVGWIPLVGDALKSLGEGAGEVANFMISSFDKAYGTFERLSDSGVVTSFTSLKDASKTIQLNFEQTERVLSKNSKNLALFAGSALRGRQTFESIALNSYEARRNFQKLGISSEEFSDMQLSYLNQQMRTGKGQKKTTEELTAGSLKYIKELDEISKLTGMSKKDLQAEREARLADARYRSGMSTVPGEIKGQIDHLLDNFMAVGATATKQGMQDLFSSDGVATTQAARDVLNQYAGNQTEVLDIIKSVRNGTMTGAQATEKMAELAKISAETFGTQAAIKGDELASTKLYVETNNLATLNAKDREKQLIEYRKKQEEILNNTDSVNSQLANTKISLEQAGRDIDQLATDSTTVTYLMNQMAEGLETVTTSLYEMAGEALPEHLKAANDERKAIKEEKKARDELIKAEKESLEDAQDPESQSVKGTIDLKLIEELNKNLQEKISNTIVAKQKRSDTNNRKNSTSSNVTQSNTENKDKLSNDYSGLNIGGRYKGEAIAGGPASQNIIDLARKMQSKYSGGVFNAFNDLAHNSGKHPKGLAFDYSLPNIPRGSKIPKEMGQEIEQFLKSNGASVAIDEYNKPSDKSTGGHIHAEVSARTGGIFSGPDSGYLAELHGTEAVVPGDMSSISNSDSSSISKRTLGSGMTMPSKSNKYERMFTNLSDKMDTLIDLMDTSVDNQKDFLTARLN